MKRNVSLRAYKKRYEVLSLITSQNRYADADYESRKIPTRIIFIVGKYLDPGQLLSTRQIEIFHAMMSIGSIWNNCPRGINWTIVLYDYYRYQNMYRRKQISLSRYARYAVKCEKIHTDQNYACVLCVILCVCVCNTSVEYVCGGRR